MSEVVIHHADMLEWLTTYDGPLFDSCVTDPPYHLTSIVKRFGKEGSAAVKVPDHGTGAYARASRGFMGKEWDGGDIAQRPETWRAVYDRLKPGAHLVAFAGTRTYHRMACAIEDAGFEIRDMLLWHYGSGFPKSHNISKAIDRMNGDVRPVVGHEKVRDIRNGHGRGQGDGINAAERDGPEYFDRELTTAASAASAAWEGWGTALKPATEPICLARKPLSEKSIAANVLKHGTGALNIDGCRCPVSAADARDVGRQINRSQRIEDDGYGMNRAAGEAGVCVVKPEGRWPANVITDGSGEVVAAFPDAPGQQFDVKGTEPSSPFANTYGDMPNRAGGASARGDQSSAARFFYSAKAGPLDRVGSKHATVKPVDLMRWLTRLVTPPGGLVLDPFAGSGTTGIACMAEQFDCTMIELEAEHVADIERKLAHLRGEGRLRFIEHDRRRDDREQSDDLGPLFSGAPQ